MKTILLVGPYPPPYGGIASLVADLAPFLASQGYRVVVLTLTKGSAETFSPAPGVEVLRTPAFSASHLKGLGWVFRARHRKRWQELEWVMREALTTDLVRRIAIAYQASLIGSYMVTSSLFVPHLKAAFGGRMKFVTTVFGELVERKDVISANKELYQDILQLSDRVLATSQYCAGLTRTLDYDPGRIEVIYIGVDLNRFRPDGASDELGLPSGNRNILFVGRFHRDMGLDVVLEAIPEVVSRLPDVRFLLVGARGPLSEIAAEVERAYPANVRLAQDVPGGHLPAYYRASEMLIAPTRDKHACMGVSIKEAMACGRPIIASNSGGIPEAVVDGETGIILRTGQGESVSREKLVRAIQELLVRPDRIRAMGQRARVRATQMFDNRVLLRRHLAVVEKLIGPVH